MQLEKLLKEKKILVCCGSGGVGKTTVSAALALSAALEGRKTLVCTIDPAKRLADSMGLKELGNNESRIPDRVFKEAGLEPKGELWGMMLDSKRTFDELIVHLAPNSETSDRILNNAFYENVTTALAGSQEFSAMEKLYELAEEDAYDLIVLDTPPTRHALEFLDAPNRVTAFLDASIVNWFVKPYLMAGKVGFRFINKSAKFFFRMLEKATGYQTLADIADFFILFEGFYDSFRARAEKVRDLMVDPGTAFVLVTSPQSPSLMEARFFLERLGKENMPLGGMVFNRVHFPPTDLSSEKAGQIGQVAREKMPDYSQATDALIANLRLLILLAEADKRSISRFTADNHLNTPKVKVPYFVTDVHDLSSLGKVAQYLK